MSVESHMGRMMGEYFLPLLENFGFFEYLKHNQDVADSDVTPAYCAKHNWLVGSPDTVAEKIANIYDEVGGFGQLLCSVSTTSMIVRLGGIRSNCSPTRCCRRSSICVQGHDHAITSIITDRRYRLQRSARHASNTLLQHLTQANK